MEKKKYNAHGEGSIGERSDGRWEARLLLNGKRKCFYGKSEQEVKKKVRLFKESMAHGEVECKKIKISVYFEEWLENTKKGKLKASSYDRLERTYRNHIRNTVGTYQLGNLSTKDCQKLINQKAQELSYSSTKKVYEALNECLTYAEVIGDINRNPMKAVVLPCERNFIKQTKEIYIPTEDEMNRIIETAFMTYSNGRPIYNLSYAYAIVIIVNTGLRIGELLALTWDKVNFDKKVMRIDCSVGEVLDRIGSEGKKRKLLVSDTKTKNGKRTVILNQKVMNALRQLQDFNMKNNIVSPYVITDYKGDLVNYRDVKRSFDKVVARAEVKAIGLHSLRHYFASVCISHDMGAFELSRMLGHGKVSITMDTYGHLMEKQEEAIRNLLEVI